MKTLIVVLCILLSATISYSQSTITVTKTGNRLEIVSKDGNNLSSTEVNISGNGNVGKVSIAQGNHLIQITGNILLVDGKQQCIINSTFKSKIINLPKKKDRKSTVIVIDEITIDKDGTMIIKQ